MKHVKGVALLLVLVQLLLLFAACGGEEAKTTGATPGTTAGAPAEAPTTQGSGEGTTTGKPVTGEPATTEPATTEPSVDVYERLCLAENGKLRYQLINSINANSELTSVVRSFASDLEEKLGVTVELVSDTVAPDGTPELLIGKCFGREASSEVMAETPYTAQRIATAGEDICFGAYSPENFERVLNTFLRMLYEEDGCWYADTVMLDYERNLYEHTDTPHYDTEAGKLQGGSYYLSQSAVTVTYEKTNRTELEAYLEKLLREGFSEHTTNQIGTIEFSTFVKGKVSVQLQFRPEEDAVTINFLKDQFIPSAEKPVYTTETRSSVNFLKRYGYEQWGLSIIIQLADGTYVLVDGGKSHSIDRNNMIKFMQDNKPASHEKPIISLWLLTHPHEDHVETFAYDAEIFAQSVEVQMIGHNIPIEPCSETDANGHYWEHYYVGVEKARAEHFPEAVVWYGHTGQKLYLADAEIEVMYTHEDYFPQYIYSANDCTTNYRISVDGVSLLILGDNHQCNAELYSMYTEALCSDMVQIAHHGNFGSAEMYAAIDAKIALWPDGKADTLNNMKLDMHVNWINTQWTRTDSNGNVVRGDRIHYTADETSRVYFDEL